MTAAVAAEQKQGSWRPLAFGLVGFLLLNLHPLVPIAQTLMFIVPGVAACALVGWKSGGRVGIAVIWLVLAAWMLIQPAGTPGTPYDWMARGWVLLLMASFGAISLWSTATPFFVRALSSIGLAAALGFAIALASPGGVARVKHAVGDELTRRSAKTLENFNQRGEWAANSPNLDKLVELTEAQLREAPQRAADLLPALLALESLGALAIAWALYHRISPVRIGPPLGPLKEFRFNDQLVWGLAVGATLYLLPPFVEGRIAGLNLLLFFGGLYLARGLGVIAWMSPGKAMLIAVIVMGLLAPPIFGVLAIALGLGDTWLDWRRRAHAA